MKKLFGTDGIRGIANTNPITPDTALKVGQALGYIFKKNKHRLKFIVGKDTRLSCYMLESALTSGLCSMGADVVLTGPMPTPGVAFITSNMNADAGIVISASHNAYTDNGIKIFSSSGYKINDAVEEQIEHLVYSEKLNDLLPPADEIGRAFREYDALGRYIVFLRNTIEKNISLSGIKIALDCANGATYKVAPTLFREMRADIIPTNINPDGRNINLNSGSLHPYLLSKVILANDAHIGFAFDGDGDRVIAIDEKGNIVTGDKILAICAGYFKIKNKLKNNRIVSTVMSNGGLHQTLRELEIERIESTVGDRMVLKKMLECGASLGGEDSGHLIFLDHHTTGDGIITALKLLEIMIETKKPLSELAAAVKFNPQTLENVQVRKKLDIEEIDELQKIIREAEKKLAPSGRVFVRYSGTQPLLRVMVEAPSKEIASEQAKKIAGVAKSVLN